MKQSNQTSCSPLDQLRRRSAVEVKLGADEASLRSLSPDDTLTLQRLLAEPQDLIDSPEFHEKGAERRIYDDAPEITKPDTSWYHPVMDDLHGQRENRDNRNKQVVLTAAEERVLFLQYNYARHRVRELQQEIWSSADRTPSENQATDMLRWHTKAERVRKQIADTNLALVLAMAKRTRMSEVDFADLVSEGNMALLRAVDKFDAGRGFKFSTYACRAILKAFSRQGMKLSRYRQRFPTDFDPALEKSDFLETRRKDQVLDAADEMRNIVEQNRADLTDIERQIIEHRFGIESGGHEKPMTLEQIGQIIGVTKERVRQIQNRALEKLREELEESYFGRRNGDDAKDKVEPSLN